jgi:hypothetical protein
MSELIGEGRFEFIEYTETELNDGPEGELVLHPRYRLDLMDGSIKNFIELHFIKANNPADFESTLKGLTVQLDQLSEEDKVIVRSESRRRLNRGRELGHVKDNVKDLDLTS